MGVTVGRLSMKIALVAQHAMPQADSKAGQVDDSRLRELSHSLASKGHRVTVYAQPHGAAAPAERTEIEPGVTVEYIGPKGGPAARSDADLLAQVPAFARPLQERWNAERPDVVHAMRWTSGLAALAATRDLRIPVVQTFDSLGVAERRHHVTARASDERIRLEPAIGRSASAVVAGSSDEQSDLTRLGVPRRAHPGGSLRRRHRRVQPRGPGGRAHHPPPPGDRGRPVRDRRAGQPDARDV